ncbi:MAG TPA: EAL domain-containing protein [Gaiellaceae bacterium]|jgi:diguanylate cyclase (GGDEF)-like protein/PAS domain S-box-containing protein
MTEFLTGPWRTRVWLWYLLVGGALTAAYVFFPPLEGNGPLINGLGLSGWVAIAVGLRMHRPRAKAPWRLFVVGQFLFWAGDLYTYSYPKLFGVDVGFPSFGDALYLAVYPVLFAGLLLLLRKRNPSPDRAAAIDALILTVGFALLSWFFLVAPNIHLSGLSPLAKAVSAAYPLGDILLLAGVIRLYVDKGKRTPAFYLLVASIVSLLVTDSAYAYALLVNAFHHQLSFDVGWIAYYLLWGAAALHPSMRTLEEPAAEARSRLTPMRLALLAAACLIAPGIRFAEEISNPDVLVVIMASAVLFLLVVARMAGLVRQEERAASRELALRRAGAELVAAAGPEQANQAAVRAVRAVLGKGTLVRLLLQGEIGLRLAASTEETPSPVPSQQTVTWLRRTAAGPVSTSVLSLPGIVRHDLAVEAGHTAVVLPLTVRDEERGLLVAVASHSVSRELVESLGTLASQVSLAVEGAALAEDLHRRQSEARFRSLVAHASDLITVLDADGIVTYQSPSVAQALGYSAEDVEGTCFTHLLSDADRTRLEQVIADAAAKRSPTGLGEMHAIECSLRHRDGAWLQFEVQPTNLLDDEHVRGIVLNSRDVSERKAFEDQLAHQAFHDPVTNLANRALFVDRVQHALQRVRRGNDVVGVMFIDLDDFKTVNDSLGHAAGDVVLQEVAQRLVASVRPSDTVARFGGDEFAVLLDGLDDSQEAATIAGRLLAELERHLAIDGKQVYPRASVGICIANGDPRSSDAGELLRNADVAMYMAKRDRKGSYRLFEPAMHERVVERLELQAELQQALELAQLEVYYQPVVRLDGHATNYGVEALLRWVHPERGTVSPLQFIPLAEETGQIIEIGRWVLNQACRQGARLHERFPRATPLTISVNISAKQLQSEGILADVRSALNASRLEPSALVLELTETAMMADADVATARLNDLKELGVRIAVDDFGTGYSSLSYLSRFPVDILKIDRSFLAAGEQDSALTAAIIAIGDRLGLDVVAEGIESSEQIGALRRLGCGLGQGYLFAKPMTHEALLDYLLGEPLPATAPMS